MQQLTHRSFALFINHILPGFILVLGLSEWLPVVHDWLNASQGAASISAVCYVFTLAVILGMSVSAVRFAVIDRILRLDGISRPAWDDRQLQDNLPAYQFLVAVHYSYYQFYANSIVALAMAYGLHRAATDWRAFPGGIEISLFFVVWVFAYTARDNLRNYYRRASLILGDTQSEDFNEQRSTSRRHKDHTIKTSKGNRRGEALHGLHQAGG